MNVDQRSPLERRIDKLGTPLSAFVRAQTTASVLLLFVTVIALLWENSDRAGLYHRTLALPLGLIYGQHYFEADLKLWINDGLMALFFFLLGLEIKREVLAGELVEPKLRLTLMLCAAGGIVVPALLYALINHQSAHLIGWGIPTATDTAFALGVLALLRRRVPDGLIMFIVGFAIIDDIGAILVIALFYTEHLQFAPLAVAATLVAIMAFANYAGFRQPLIYIVGGMLTWYAVLRSGIHPTLAGVAVAMTVPARPKKQPRVILSQAKNAISAVQASGSSLDVLADKQQHDLIQDVKSYAEQASTPLRRWEAALELPVALVVLPLFALVNAGVVVNTTTLMQVITEPVGQGVMAGLVLGKFMGISGACALALRFRWGILPKGVRFVHVVGASLIGGMGFTMSTFIATRGFDVQPEMLRVAKTAILMSSLIAALLGSAVLYRAGRGQQERGSGVSGANATTRGESCKTEM